MIELNAVTKMYRKRPVVSDVSLSIGKGDVVGLVGPNGAGKSPLIQIMATVLKPTSGKIAIDGKDPKKQLQDVRQLIGYVPQELALYSDLSVRDNLAFWSKMAAVKVTQARIHHIVDIVGLSEKMSEKVHHLSGGMQQKLNIAVALLHDPAILIMDEPTVGIDIQSKQEIVTFIESLSKQGKTVVYSSHDTQEIEQLCHKLAIMNEGKLQFYGSVEAARATARKKGFADNERGSFPEMLSLLGRW